MTLPRFASYLTFVLSFLVFFESSVFSTEAPKATPPSNTNEAKAPSATHEFKSMIPAEEFLKSIKVLAARREDLPYLSDAQFEALHAKISKVKETAGYKALINELCETEAGVQFLLDNLYTDPTVRQKVEDAMAKFETKYLVAAAKELYAKETDDGTMPFDYPSFTPAGIQYNIFNPDPTFLMHKRMISPFGTIVKPAMIYSPKPYRIVGCAGPYEDPHTVGFFAMEGYLKHACPECGQVFQLTTNPDEVCWDYLPVKSDEDKMKHFL